MEYLWKVLICFAAFVSVVLGMKCYDCAYNDDDIGTSYEANQLCKDADEKLVLSCDDDKKHCLKIAGLVNGKPGGLRQCAGENWNRLVKGDEDKCIDAATIPKFGIKLDNKAVVLTNGTVCVCSTEACNGQENIIPGIFSILSTTFLAVVFTIRH